MGKGKTLDLQVVNGAGQPLQNARVCIESAPIPVPDIAALSDELGRIALRLPSAGKYEIGCLVEGYKPLTLEVHTSTENLSKIVVLEKLAK